MAHGDRRRGTAGKAGPGPYAFDIPGDPNRATRSRPGATNARPRPTTGSLISKTYLARVESLAASVRLVVDDLSAAGRGKRSKTLAIYRDFDRRLAAWRSTIAATTIPAPDGARRIDSVAGAKLYRDAEESVLACLPQMIPPNGFSYRQGGLRAKVACASERFLALLADAPQEKRSHPPILSALQQRILAALDGKSLSKDGLARACSIDASKLYRTGKPSGLDALLRRGDVAKRPGKSGYYRVDAPPPEAIAPGNSSATNRPPIGH